MVVVVASMVMREEEELAGGSRVCRCSGVARMVALRRRRTRWCATRCRDDGGWMRGAVADLLQRRGGAARRCAVSYTHLHVYKRQTAHQQPRSRNSSYAAPPRLRRRRRRSSCAVIHKPP
ncbi:hypothetical protein DEO72_LG9g1952 [Vigna unguiculata]|uniref:Uncharacterized protein n=1 Tax=Vigna unguiculata TaxID=3917 RepID=A0A4D6N0Z7_VIGUN|nr:hypothetical protein DEO72_LG9g1952 [Vigna unguiculata]